MQQIPIVPHQRRYSVLKKKIKLVRARKLLLMREQPTLAVAFPEARDGKFKEAHTWFILGQESRYVACSEQHQLPSSSADQAFLNSSKMCIASVPISGAGAVDRSQRCWMSAGLGRSLAAHVKIYEACIFPWTERQCSITCSV